MSITANFDRNQRPWRGQYVRRRKLPFVAGHALNCYNAVTLRLLRKARNDALVHAG